MWQLMSEVANRRDADDRRGAAQMMYGKTLSYTCIYV